MPIKEYSVVECDEVADMDSHVSTMLKNGWTLHGELIVITHGRSDNAYLSDVRYIQAMVKEGK